MSYGLKYTQKDVSDIKSIKELCLSSDAKLHIKAMNIFRFGLICSIFEGA